NTAAVLDVAGALYEGADSRLGRTMWQSVDGALLGGLGAEAGKRIFTRVRPRDANDPCLWSEGGSNRSFPSSEAAVSAGLVMPYVLEYGRERPAAYALLLIPAYVGVARVKNHAHWPTDVVAGWAIGAAAAWYDHRRETPLFVSILPRSVTIGFRKSF
ncbi:MAG TPA: phosphatase PAP2 family protein, partial [Usitatibacter sp.]|nr:phosphatase PAP2 family protein [Usitatibacter sp.]